MLKFASYVFCYLALFFNLYACVSVYEKLSFKSVKFSLTNILVLFLFALCTFLNSYYSVTVLKLFLSILIVFLMYIYYFRESFFLTLFKLLIIYLFLYLCDFSISVIFMFFPFHSVSDLGNLTVIKGLCTILVSLMLILIFTINKVSKFITELVENAVKKLNLLFLVIPICILFISIVLIYLYALELDLNMFLIVVFLISFFLMLCIIMIVQYFDNKHKETEQKSLLELMNEYERILENDRIKKHDTLNHFITLKTYENKSSSEYEALIDNIMAEYDLNANEFYSKLYKLPSGIKGIIYYKIANIKDKEINVNLVISNKVKEKFESLNSRLYFRVCKILGIIIDNALEAASESSEKYVLVDIYLEDENIIFYLENSFSNNIDLDRITEKGKSSKGSNRGYGLFIANKLVKERDDISLEQHINDHKFITVLKIKNP